MDGVNKAEFNDLLLKFSQEPRAEERDAIDKKIWEKFGTEKAVLILDMSGFSLLTQRYGVVHYLSMVRRMQLTATPIIESYGGFVIKYEADNCFAVFPDSLGATRASIALNLAFDAANILTPDELDIRISCGIDQGSILLLDNNDFYGNAVNVASKLGEDVAQPGEILLTDNAAARLPKEAAIELKAINFNISGIQIEGYTVVYRR